MKLSFALFAVLPLLATAVPTEHEAALVGRQQASQSTSTRVVTVTATKTVTVCNASSSVAKASSSSSAVKSSSSVSPSSSRPAPSSSTSKSGAPPASSSTSKPAPAASSSTSKPASAAASSSSSKAAPAASSSAAASPVSTADRDLFLKLHNEYRAKYSANAVTWDETLATFAYNAAKTCKYGHTGGPYGENIAAGVGGGYNINSAFTAWGPNEAKGYNYDNPGASTGVTGHFTQVVWKGTNRIGCAAVTCPDNTIFNGYKQNSLYVVCEYAPPGNIVGNNWSYYKANVGRPVA